MPRCATKSGRHAFEFWKMLRNIALRLLSNENEYHPCWPWILRWRSINHWNRQLSTWIKTCHTHQSKWDRKRELKRRWYGLRSGIWRLACRENLLLNGIEFEITWTWQRRYNRIQDTWVASGWKILPRSFQDRSRAVLGTWPDIDLFSPFVLRLFLAKASISLYGMNGRTPWSPCNSNAPKGLRGHREEVISSPNLGW